MMTLMLLCVVFVAVLALASQSSEAKCRPPPPKKHSPHHHRSSPPPPAVTRTMAVFGDSLCDNGNLFKLNNFTYPDPSIYYNGRFSNGLVWPEYMPVLSKGTYTKIFNYAYGSAFAADQFANYDALLGPTGQPVNLGKQTDKYLSQRTAPSPSVVNTVVMLIGSNDILTIFDALLTGTNISVIATDSAIVVQNILANVGKLAASGETNIVIGNIPPADIVPYITIFPTYVQTIAETFVEEFNMGLAAAVTEFQAAVPHTTLYNLDCYHIIKDNYLSLLAANETLSTGCVTTTPANMPSTYGARLANVTTHECASKGVGYFFYDWKHPTTTVHAMFAANLTGQLKTWGLL